MTRPSHLHGALLAAAGEHGARPAQRWAGAGGAWETRTHGALRDLALRVAAGLVEKGVKPGDRVVLVADNGPWWLPADLGILAAGAADVPRGTDTTPAELGILLEHSGARGAIAVGEEALRRVQAAPGSGSLGFLLRLDAPSGEGLIDRPAPDPSSLPAAGPEDLASVIYTSGTTGRAKGVTLLHRNFLHQLRTLPGAFDFRPGDRFLVMLPPWHCFERVVEYVALQVGGEIVHSHPRLLKEHIPAVRPTWMASVPRIWEMVLALSGWPRLAPRDPERAAAALRAAVGGELRCAVAGGGRCPDVVDRAFNGAGIRFLVGYGLTETSPVLTVRRPEDNLLGTIGKALPETEIRVVHRESGAPLASGGTGVIQARGPQVMRGYWKDPEVTARVLSPEGWFDTGDLGELTQAGDLMFRGRAKDTIALRGGEKVEPQPLEDRIAESPFVEYVVVVGQDRKVLGALIVPRGPAIEAELKKSQEVTAEDLLKKECARLLTEEAGFAAHERVARVAVLKETFTPENGLVTGTLKVKRQAVLDRYAAEIEALFGKDS